MRKRGELSIASLTLGGENAYDAPEAFLSELTGKIRPFDEHTLVLKVDVLIEHGDICRGLLGLLERTAIEAKRTKGKR